MVNADGEKLVFNKPVPIDGQIETWLLNVEDSMQKSLKQLMAKALAEYNRIPFDAWIFTHPTQIVLTAILIAWTRKVQLSLEKESPKEHLMQYEHFLRKRTETVCELLQKNDLSILQRSTLKSLIIVDSHCIDVTRRLINSRTESPHDFEWTRHLRFFYDEKKHKCYVKQTNTMLQYGYEFVGTTAR